MYNYLIRKYYAHKIPKGNGKKVAVGLSGGVDSSVSAALLKERGYDVTGVFIKVWQPDFLTCSWKEDRRDAMRVCSQLGIPFISINLEVEFKKSVVDYMVSEYEKGHTPNPDIMCNTHVKFGAFYKWAIDSKYDFVATGHYAQVIRSSGSECALHKGVDNSKDQSYFIWQIKKEQLKHVLFPIGHIHKNNVRKIADSYKLITANKKDSQGLCFLGHVDIADFLSHFITLNKGQVKDIRGTIIGHHDGAALYTVGQRHGFTVESKSENSAVLYIVEKDISKNELVVDETPISKTINHDKVVLREVYFRKDYVEQSHAQIRYHGKKYPVKIVTDVINNTICSVSFNQAPEGLSVGQSIVFYRGTECVGGGIIDEAMVK